MRVDPAGAAHKGVQSMLLLLLQLGAGGGQSLQLLVLLLTCKGPGAHHFLRQWVACRAAEGVLSGHSPHLKSLVLLQVLHLEGSAHILLRVQETHLEASLTAEDGKPPCRQPRATDNSSSSSTTHQHWQVVCSSTDIGLGSAQPSAGLTPQVERSRGANG